MCLVSCFELRCLVFSRPYQDVHGVVPGFQERNQIVHFHVHASLEGGLQSRHSHALVRVAQPGTQGRFGQRWVAHAGGTNRIAVVVCKALCNIGVPHQEQSPGRFPLHDVVFIVQGNQRQRNALLAKRSEKVGASPANVQIAVIEKGLDRFTTRHQPPCSVGVQCF